MIDWTIKELKLISKLGLFLFGFILIISYFSSILYNITGEEISFIIKFTLWGTFLSFGSIFSLNMLSFLRKKFL